MRLKALRHTVQKADKLPPDKSQSSHLYKQNWLQFLFVVQVNALKQQIIQMSNLYPYIISTEVTYRIYTSQWPVVIVKANLQAVITPPPIVERSIVMGVSVCLCACVCVCLPAVISSELHVRSSPIFLRVLPLAVARSSFGGVVICYAFPVLRMKS